MQVFSIMHMSVQPTRGGELKHSHRCTHDLTHSDADQADLVCQSVTIVLQHTQFTARWQKHLHATISHYTFAVACYNSSNRYRWICMNTLRLNKDPWLNWQLILYSTRELSNIWPLQTLIVSTPYRSKTPDVPGCASDFYTALKSSMTTKHP